MSAAATSLSKWLLGVVALTLLGAATVGVLGVKDAAEAGPKCCASLGEAMAKNMADVTKDVAVLQTKVQAQEQAFADFKREQMYQRRLIEALARDRGIRLEREQ